MAKAYLEFDIIDMDTNEVSVSEMTLDTFDEIQRAFERIAAGETLSYAEVFGDWADDG